MDEASVGSPRSVALHLCCETSDFRVMVWALGGIMTGCYAGRKGPSLSALRDYLGDLNSAAASDASSYTMLATLWLWHATVS